MSCRYLLVLQDCCNSSEPSLFPKKMYTRHEPDSKNFEMRTMLAATLAGTCFAVFYYCLLVVDSFLGMSLLAHGWLTLVRDYSYIVAAAVALLAANTLGALRARRLVDNIDEMLLALLLVFANVLTVLPAALLALMKHPDLTIMSGRMFALSCVLAFAVYLLTLYVTPSGSYSRRGTYFYNYGFTEFTHFKSARVVLKR